VVPGQPSKSGPSGGRAADILAEEQRRKQKEEKAKPDEEKAEQDEREHEAEERRKSYANAAQLEEEALAAARQAFPVYSRLGKTSCGKIFCCNPTDVGIAVI